MTAHPTVQAVQLKLSKTLKNLIMLHMMMIVMPDARYTGQTVQLNCEHVINLMCHHHHHHPHIRMMMIIIDAHSPRCTGCSVEIVQPLQM